MKKEEKEKEVKEIASPANTGTRDGGGDVNTGTESGEDTGVIDDGINNFEGTPLGGTGSNGPKKDNPDIPDNEDGE